MLYVCLKGKPIKTLIGEIWSNNIIVLIQEFTLIERSLNRDFTVFPTYFFSRWEILSEIMEAQRLRLSNLGLDISSANSNTNTKNGAASGEWSFVCVCVREKMHANETFFMLLLFLPQNHRMRIAPKEGRK